LLPGLIERGGLSYSTNINRLLRAAIISDAKEFQGLDIGDIGQTARNFPIKLDGIDKTFLNTLDELIKAKDFQKALTHIESHKDNGIPDKHLRSIKIVFLPKCLI